MASGGFNEKRSLEEVIFAYDMEPDLRDVFVEGRTDKVLIEHVLSSPNLRVWEEGEIDVPGDLVTSYGLDIGCKGRVITLALELEKRLASADLQVRCIVDADSDRVLGTDIIDAKYLRYTDFTCIESYFWDAEHLQKYIKIALHDTLGFTAEELIKEMSPILREVFLLRVVHKYLDEGWKWVEVASCVTARKGAVSFDREKFMRKYLQSNSAWHRREEFEQVVEIHRAKLDADIRHSLQGHDLTGIVSELVKECVKPKALGQPEVVARMLAMTIEREDSLKFPLLREFAESDAK
ncbi:DUF4435 domain-containing protein [Streptomyces olivaceus]|uniref:DUF4435 domain-containing protein n=1 Tax=Streptomyces olivaceus TaxID=47716 RepID=UPI0033BA3BD5